MSRLGATLSEILVSVLVMSIGVVSLATLFPISVLRSIQASQLTNATIHRLNAEELIGLFPRLVHDPDVDGNLIEHEIQNTVNQNPNPNRGLDNPESDFVNEGRFIVDPLGWNSPNLATVQSEFGNNVGASIDNGSAPSWPAIDGRGATVLRRYNGGFNSAQAFLSAYQGDTWRLIGKGTPTGQTATSVTVAPGIDLATFTSGISNYANNERARVVLFSPNGKQSVVRDHSPASPISVAGQTVTWTGAVPWATISRFRLETFDARYSWLLSVRKLTNPSNLGHGSAAVDVVVFHKRGLSQATEQIYLTQQPTATLPDGRLFHGTNRIILDLALTPGAPKPFLKKGGFIFDARQAHWYRIAHVTGEDTPTPTISIDRPGVSPSDRFMTLPGVVDVFPIGSIPYDPNNAP